MAEKSNGRTLLDETKVLLRALMVSNPEALTISQLAKDFQEMEGNPIPFSKLGYKTLTDFLLSMPDIMTYNTRTRTCTAVISENSKNKHVQQLVDGQKPPKRTRDRNQNRYGNTQQQMYSSYNHMNIYGNENLTHHQRRFEPGNLLAPPNTLQPSLLGPYHPYLLMPTVQPAVTYDQRALQGEQQNYRANASANNRARSVASNGPARQNNQNRSEERQRMQSGNSQCDVQSTASEGLNGHSEKVDDSQSDSNSEEISALPPIDDDDPVQFIGTAIMSGKYGTSIPPAIRPNDFAKSGDISQICVTEVTRLPNFYFQFHSTDSTMKIMQEELDSSVGHGYVEKIKPSDVRVGNVCAVFYPNKWCRAEVITPPDDSYRLKLLFVDYGTIEYVSVETLHYISKDLCKIPRLCHRGALAFINPCVNYEIEQKIVKTFCELVADIPLVAVFSHIDENQTFSVTLVDTSGSDVDKIVNKFLLNI